MSLGDRERPRRNWLIRRETILVGLLAAGFAAAMAPQFARAADDDDEESSGSWTDRIGDSIKGTFEGAGKAVGMGPRQEGPPPNESPSGCPPIYVLDGTVGHRVYAPGATGNQGVRYQFSIVKVGRQCSIGAGRVSLKVAASGRLLLGPAGAPGTFSVPLRVVVFNEAQQKPAASKLYSVPSSVPSGQSSAPFEFVSDDITVPLSGDAAREYSIKVGIDPAGAGGGGAVAKPKRHRAKPQTAAAQ